MPRPPTVRVWDLPVRLLHLALVGGVVLAGWTGAGWTGGSARSLDLHIAAGWLVVGALVLRVAWGLVGTEHARWRAFLVPGSQVRAWVRGLIDGTAPRVLGHNPLAAWAMLGGLGILILLTVTGLLVQAGEEGEGPLAGHVPVGAGIVLHAPHGWLAWALLGWIGLHLAGVFKESLRTRENLPLSMITGHKRASPGSRGVRRSVGAALPVLALMGLSGLEMVKPRPLKSQGARALPSDALFEAECGDCHMAWHPSLLPARSWVTLMATQADHFGEDLMLSPETAGHIQDFLVKNAAELSPTEAAYRTARTTPHDRSPLRITETPYWVEAHASVSPDQFQAEPVRSANRCEACHEDAITGVFANRMIHDPNVPMTTQKEKQ